MARPSRPQWAMMNEDMLQCGYLGDPAAIGFLEGLALACEEAGQGLLLVPVSPEQEDVTAVHQAGVDTDAAAGAEHGSLDQPVDGELARDRRQRLAASLVAHRRLARDHVQ